jgi:hypothetical protein
MKALMGMFERVSVEILYVVVVLADLYVRIRRALGQRHMDREAHVKANDRLTQAYCDFNRGIFKPHTQGRQAFVLMDCFPIPVWVAANSILSNRLAERFGAEICSYGEAARDPLTDVLYNSFGCERHLQVAVPASARRRRKQLFIEAVETLKTKDELFNYSIDGVKIGDEIYETYLRQFSKPTAELESLRCRYVILTALNYYLFFEDFFTKNKVAAAVLSHDFYVSMGILAKIAWGRGIPVYLANGHDMKKTTRPDEKYAEFTRYREYFSTLGPAERQAGIDWGRAQLEKRLGGVVGVNMAYSTKSAYTTELIERQTASSNKIKIVIATHCFFDNPRCYGGMLFTDFYEWISFLGKLAEETDYDWYIKTHRDFLPGTMETVKELTERYPRLKLINPNTTWHQLRDEGVSVALTSYGSIGHELPLLGYKVINAGYNPHIAYRFNWHAKDIDEYRKLLLGLDNLGPIRELESVFEFYYVHHELARRGGFLFSSCEEMAKYVAEDVYSNRIFDTVLSGGDALQKGARDSIDVFLDSDAFSEAEMILFGPRKKLEAQGDSRLPI